MKKWIAFFLALVMALSLCACGKSSENTPADTTETVQVAVLTQLVMTEKNDDGSTSIMKGIVEYDEAYNLIGTRTYFNDQLNLKNTYDKDPEKPLLEQEYNSDGTPGDRTEYRYDAQGNCVERTRSYSYDGKPTTSRCVSTYDANGNVLTEHYYENGELNYEYRYTYNADGKLLKETCIEDGVETYWREKTYDSHGNLLSDILDGMLSGSYEYYENTYDGDKLAEVKVYEQNTLSQHKRYDSDGNVISQISYDVYTGEEWSRTESTYENGKLAKEVRYYEGQEQSVSTYSYNTDGKLTERSFTPTGDKTQRRVYTYGDHGDVIGIKAYDGDKLLSEYTLTYETVTVSKETAQQIKETNGFLTPF